jgi:hypothetical protein
METGFFENVKRFFFPKEEVLNHWYIPVDHFQLATSDFYQMVEKGLTERKVPSLNMSRVELSEGGMLSAKREYLRLSRERLVFDICASPFGTSYFFSVRFVELPLGIDAAQMLVLVVGFVLIVSLLVNMFGTLYGSIVMLALVGSAIWLMRNAVRLGFKDLDSSLIKAPMIGPLYEIFFRKETYYREDTRLMYLTTVDGIVKALVEEVTAGKGIKLLKRYDRKPVSGEAYQPVETPLKTPESSPAV